ncbi:MAG: hypothetical protein HN590_16075 [Calditrichaeota bacterium]|nr:hypothetical protein [Bacteroidota bacterium]MBT7618793.1 hypothetical protein [Calditrichota bacterium]
MYSYIDPEPNYCIVCDSDNTYFHEIIEDFICLNCDPKDADLSDLQMDTLMEKEWNECKICKDEEPCERHEEYVNQCCGSL